MAVLAMGSLSAMADYDYLNIVSTSGTTTSLAVSGLKLTFADGKLIATNGQTTLFSEELSSQSYMYFGNTNGISEVESEQQTGDVYSLDGYKVKSFSGKADLSDLPSGVYIIKQGDKQRKIAVQ